MRDRRERRRARGHVAWKPRLSRAARCHDFLWSTEVRSVCVLANELWPPLKGLRDGMRGLG
jgi:hypothetical protein